MDDDKAVILEAQQGEKPASFIPMCNSKHRPPTSSDAYDVQGTIGTPAREPTKLKLKEQLLKIQRKLQTARRRKKKKWLNEARFLENLALESTGQEEEEEDAPSAPLYHVSRYVSRNPPVVINPIGRGIRVCKGCPNGISEMSSSTPTICCLEE